MSSSDEYTENLHKGAKASTFENARQLRRTETEAEKKLWLYELDGAIHNNEMNRQYDNVSTPFLRQHYNIKSGYLY